MKKEGILLIIGVLLIIVSFITVFTGHAARWTDSYNPQYQGGAWAPEREDFSTWVEILPNEINEEGVGVVYAGNPVYFVIHVGYDGIVKDEVKLKNSAELVRLKKSDICSNAFCVDPSGCSQGFICYEDRAASFFLPDDIEEREYFVSVKNRNMEEIKSKPFIVKGPNKKISKSTYYQGQTSPN